MACLIESRMALGALTEVFTRADQETVKNAITAVDALPPLARCSDTNQLQSPVEPLHDATTRERVEQIRTRLATAKALNDTGKFKEAGDLTQGLLVEARATGYQTLIAEALLAHTRCFVIAIFKPEVLKELEEAFSTALGVGRDDLAAEAAILRAGFACRQAAFDEGWAWAKLGTAVLDRAGPGQDLLRSWLFTSQGVLAYQQHRPEAALAFFEQAAASRQKILPAEHPDVAAALNNEANALDAVGRDEEALSLARRSYDIYIRNFGPSSSEAAPTLNNIGEYLVALGRPAEALEPLRRSLAGWEAEVGPDHQFLGYPLTATGRALLALGRPQDAIGPLERALHLREAKEPDASLVAETRFALARSLWDADADRALARSLGEKARGGYAKANDAKDLAQVEAWLAQRGGRR
jgi:hypothetical protein